jgi:hypothetical protein
MIYPGIKEPAALIDLWAWWKEGATIGAGYLAFILCFDDMHQVSI